MSPAKADSAASICLEQRYPSSYASINWVRF